MTDAQCLAAGLDLRRAWRGGELLPARATTEHPLGRFAELYAISQGDLLTRLYRPHRGKGTISEAERKRRKREAMAKVRADLKADIERHRADRRQRAGLTTEAA